MGAVLYRCDRAMTDTDTSASIAWIAPDKIRADAPKLLPSAIAARTKGSAGGPAEDSIDSAQKSGLDLGLENTAHPFHQLSRCEDTLNAINRLALIKQK